MKRSIIQDLDSKRSRVNDMLEDIVPLEEDIDDDNGEEGENDDEENFSEPNPDATLQPVDKSQWATARTELGTVAKKFDWSSLNFMSGAVQTIKLYTALDLEFVPDFDDIRGLPAAKEILTSRVLPIIRLPDAYEIGKPSSVGFTKIQRVFYLYGSKGTGKRSVLRAFCKRTGVTLIEACGPRFSVEKELEAVYKLAETHQPSIVMFSNCELQFTKDSPNVTGLSQILEAVCTANSAVWTFFRSELQIGVIDPRLQELIEVPIWAEVPNAFERSRIWLDVLDPLMAVPLRENQLRQLSDIAVDCTPRNIHKFVRYCINQKNARLSQELDVHNAEDMKLSFEDLSAGFIELPEIGRRITNVNPTSANVEPYGQIRRAERPPVQRPKVPAQYRH